MDVVVRLADLGEAEILAALHREAAMTGYGHIFPTEAKPPTPNEVPGSVATLAWS